LPPVERTEPEPQIAYSVSTSSRGIGSASRRSAEAGIIPGMSMELPPLPKLDYADARPIASQLHCQTEGDHVCVWRDPPTLGMLVKEFAAPLICLPMLAFFVVLLGIRIARTQASGLAELVQLQPVATLGIIPASFAFVYLLMDAWQNAGIVTRIDVGEGWFTWTKRTLFGERTRRWRADTITAVRVRALGIDNMLKIHRRGGFPLGAFSRCRPEELHWAADVIRAALGLPPR
jgi:hypothetical protein